MLDPTLLEEALQALGAVLQARGLAFEIVDQGPRSKHVADLRQLTPTPDELLAAARWTRQHDPSEPFREELLQALRFFGVDGVDDQI